MRSQTEPREVDGKLLDPTLTGRGWCDVCGGITARNTVVGSSVLANMLEHAVTWRHGWCEGRETSSPNPPGLIARYLNRLARKAVIEGMSHEH